MKKKVIGIIGTIASGKDLAAEYIAAQLRIPRHEISQPLKDLAQERGIALTRENLVKFGREIAAEEGMDYLAKVILEKIPSTGVVAGMRQIPQIEYLRDNADLVLLAIDADPAVRFARASGRGKSGEAATLVEFIEREQEENSGTVQRLFDCMKLADYHLVNDGSVEELKQKIDSILMERHLMVN